MLLEVISHAHVQDKTFKNIFFVIRLKAYKTLKKQQLKKIYCYMGRGVSENWPQMSFEWPLIRINMYFMFKI